MNSANDPLDPIDWQRIKHIVQAALDEPVDRRSAFVDDACLDDEQLRVSVQALLADDSCPSGFLEPPVPDAAMQVLVQHVEGGAGLTRIGPYEVRSFIGSGGLGLVYSAVDTTHPDAPPVAVKVLKRGLAGGDVLRRFHQEQQFLAGLEHSNIARFIQSGTTADGLNYLIMEYVSGKPIDAFCDQAALSINARLALFQEVCSAVQYAHRNLIVHRDLKPSNLLVTAAGVPKLLDFGIAKLLSQDSSRAAQDLTLTGHRFLTPQYASPEQISGKPMSTASDVYSLGLILYELLAGHPPYSLRGKSQRDILRLIEDTDSAPPSTQFVQSKEVLHPDGTTTTITPESVSRARCTNPRVLRQTLRGDLDTIVMTAIQKSPQRRYASVEQLSEDIRRFQEGLPIRARPDTWRYRTAKFLRRNKLAVAAAVIALLSVVGGTAGLAMGLVQARRAGEALEQEADNARQAARRAASVTEFLKETVLATGPFSNPEDTTVLELLNLTAGQVEQEFQDDPDTRAALHQTIGRTYTHWARFDQARRHLQAALDLREATPHTVEYADGLQDMAELLRLESKLQQAETLHRQALDIRLQLPETEDVELARSFNDLALTLREAGEYPQAEEYYHQAIAHYRGHEQEEAENYALSLHNLASLHRARADHEGCRKLYEQIMEFVREHWVPEHPAETVLLSGYASCLEGAEDYAAAEPLYRRSLEILRARRDPPPIVLASTLSRLGRLHRKQGRYDEAERAYQEALAIRLPLLPDDHELIGEIYNGLGVVYSKLGKFEEARANYQRGLDIVRGALGEDHPTFADHLHNLALAEMRLGHHDQAEPHYLEAIGIWDRVYGDRGHPKLAHAYQALGHIHKLRGEYEDSEHWFRRMLTTRRTHLPPDHPSLAATLYALGGILMRQSKDGEAEPFLRECLQINERAYGAEHLRTALARRTLGRALANEQHFEEAEALLTDGLTVLQRIKGPSDRQTLLAVEWLAELYESWGRTGQAEQYRAVLDELAGHAESEEPQDQQE